MSKSEDLIVWSRKNGMIRLAARCAVCNGHGRLYEQSIEVDDCDHCFGLGWFGIDPTAPVTAQPGSVERIAMMSVRYASGERLWNQHDRTEDEFTARSLHATAAERNSDSKDSALMRLSLAP